MPRCFLCPVFYGSQQNHKKSHGTTGRWPEFAPNEEVGELESCTKFYLGNFKI